MDPLIGAAALEFAGGIASNLFSGDQAGRQMRFQERMSNTQYQRGVADMKAAGLNPMMMFGGKGGGASSPSGAMAEGRNPAAGMSGAFSARRQLELEDKRIEIERGTANSVIEKNEADAARARAAAGTEGTQQAVHMAQINELDQKRTLMAAEKIVSDWTARNLEDDNARKEVMGRVWRGVADVLDYINKPGSSKSIVERQLEEAEKLIPENIKNAPAQVKKDVQAFYKWLKDNWEGVESWFRKAVQVPTRSGARGVGEISDKDLR